MLELLTCQRGHFWERSGEGASAAPVCPECGAPAETLPLLDLAPEAAAASLPPPIPPAVPALFDSRGHPVVAGYEILEDLGRAPTGVRRYRAKQRVVNRVVLLEVVAAREDASQQAWGCLRGAAVALGKASHPNIVQIYESGERDRQLFYNAVELVEGPTLAQKVAEKPLPFRQIVRLMELLARAVERAHEQGLLHRCLKPSSILLSEAAPLEKSLAAGDFPGASCLLHSRCYIPRITHFGLARRPIEGDPTDVELYGDEVGYLSPEQAWGRAKEISRTTDVYGLGSVLYFLLTGRPPFRGPTLPDVLDAIQTADLVPPADIRRVPRDLNAICRKCLARLPRRRYASAGELADDLRRAALSLPLAGRPESNATKFGKWVRRRPAVAGVVLTAFLGLTASLIGYCVGVAGSEGDTGMQWQLRAEAENARTEAAHLRTQVAQMKAAEQFTAYRQKLAQVQQELGRNNFDQARVILQGCAEGCRGLEWHYLNERAFGRGEPILLTEPGLTALAFYPTAERFLAIVSPAPGRGPGRVRLWDVRTGVVSLSLSNFPGPIHALCFSPDGKSLTTAGGDEKDVSGQVCLWPLGEGRHVGPPSWSRDFPGQRATGVAFSPDETTIVVARGGGSLVALSAAAGDLVGDFRQVFLTQQTATTRVRFCPDGSQFASFTRGQLQVSLWMPTFPLVQRIVAGPGKVHDVAFSRQWLAVAWSDNTVQLYDRRQGNVVVQVGHFPQPVRRLAFSPDGARLAGACEDDTIRIWAMAGNAAVELLALEGKATSGLAFNASGKALAGADAQTVRVWGARGQ